MNQFLQVLLLSLLQGVSELFPISSLGHTVILGHFFGVNIKADNFLPLVVLLHLGTATALFIYFWREWVALIRAFARSVYRGRLSGDEKEKLAWLIVIGTIPAGILGIFLEKEVQLIFGSALIAAIFLIVNGVLMFVGEQFRRRQEPQLDAREKQEASFKDIEMLNWKEALIIGSSQALAFIPGISRSGVTMVCGLMLKLKHEAAARYSFLLATPVIAAAGLLETPKLFAPGQGNILVLALAGGVLSGLAAWASVTYLMRYFKVGRLTPFAYYCWAGGALALLLLLVIPR